MTGPPIDDDGLMHPPGTWYCAAHRQWHGACHKKHGGRCHNAVPEGLRVCRIHGGSTQQQQVVHLAAVEARRNPIAGQPMDIGPAEALLWRVRVLSGELARLDATIAGLEHDDLIWGITEAVQDTRTKSTQIKYGARLNVWLLLREKREAALASACEAALRAGVEERLVRVAEQYGAVIHTAITRILARMDIPADDPRIGVVVPEVLRELTA